MRPPCAPPLLGRYRHVLKAWLWFVGSVAVLIQGLIWARPFTDGTLTRWIASVSAAVLRLLGAEARVEGTLIVSTLGSVEIIRECTAVYPTAFYVAAVIAYPCAPSRKLLGIGLGIVAIQVINLVRVVSLCYIHKFFPSVFETAHLIVWQSLVVFFTLVLWLLWSTELAGVRKRHAA
jgi:exosortase H (IPTLxxWG-CTERM-specific)